METMIFKDDDKQYEYYLDGSEGVVLHGEYTWYYKSGRVFEHSYYNHDLCHGEYRLYYNNGSTWERKFYVYGKVHGEYRCYSEYGELCEHSFYINGDYHPYVEMTCQEKLLFQIKHPGFKFLDDV